MNYLAHFYLSGGDDALLCGNFIADAVKGKNYLKFPAAIARGILMHREIDTYTDEHPLVRAATKFFYPSQRKYAPVVVDVVMDYFLASNWSEFHAQPLPAFAADVYDRLLIHAEHWPKRSARFYQYMSTNNALVGYSDPLQLERVFSGMDHRTPYPSNMQQAVAVMLANHDALNTIFLDYYPQLIAHINSWNETY